MGRSRQVGRTYGVVLARPRRTVWCCCGRSARRVLGGEGGLRTRLEDERLEVEVVSALSSWPLVCVPHPLAGLAGSIVSAPRQPQPESGLAAGRVHAAQAW